MNPNLQLQLYSSVVLIILVWLCHYLESTEAAAAGPWKRRQLVKRSKIGSSRDRDLYGFPYESRKRADADVPIFHDPTEEATESSTASVNLDPLVEVSNGGGGGSFGNATVLDDDDYLDNRAVREGFLEDDLFEGFAEAKHGSAGGGDKDLIPEADIAGFDTGLGHNERVAVRGRVGSDLYEEEKQKLFIITTTQVPSPMIDFTKEATLHFNQPCQAYGEHINELQWSSDPVSEKKKKLGGEETVEYFGSQICDFMNKRLECIPNEPRILITAPPSKRNDANAGAGDNIDDTDDGGEDTVDDDEVIASFPKPSGTCQCMRALGQKAEWWLEEKTNNYRCVIPADLGLHSSCGFDINYPYGEILDHALSTKRSFSAATACTENSNCTTGYTYTGLRCHCNKGTHMNKLTPGKCTPDSLAHAVRPEQAFIYFMCIISFISFIIPI